MSKIKENKVTVNGETVTVTEVKVQTIDLPGVKSELSKVQMDMEYIINENNRLKNDFSALKDYKKKLEDALLKLKQDEIVEDNDDLNLE